MVRNCLSKATLVFLLVLSLVATGCSAQWISVALADLPVLLQMAMNIGTVVSTLQSGQPVSATDAAAMQNISSEAARDLTLLQTLYNEYKAAPNTSTIQKIQNAIADANQNLPALLKAAHIADPALSARVTAAVNLILDTVNSFAALIPAPATPAVAHAAMRKAASVPRPDEIKKQWNLRVCGSAEGGSIDPVTRGCLLK
jgi:hypothetical protein